MVRLGLWVARLPPAVTAIQQGDRVHEDGFLKRRRKTKRRRRRRTSRKGNKRKTE